MREAESHAVAYYLGSSVMHSETRVAVNATGFCPHHWSLLAKAGRPQSLALIGHTFLETTLKELVPAVARLSKSKPGRKTLQATQDLAKQLEQREQGCLVCRKMDARLQRYAYTVVHLWHTDSEFRQEFTSGKGVCLHHVKHLLAMASKVLDAKETQLFGCELGALVERNLQRLEREVWWMTQKYKAEHVNDPWNGCEDAHKRFVAKLVGEGRLVRE